MTTFERILLGEFLNPKALGGALFYALVFLLLTWLGTRFLHLTMSRLEGGLLDRTTTRFIRSMGTMFIWILAFTFYAHLIPELRSLGTALLAGVSIASIVFGIAAQGTLGNLIAGLSLVIYRPFGIGDLVRLTVPAGVETGTIEDISLGYTVIRTGDDNLIVAPNSVMVSQAIIKSDT